ncbi:MAG: glucan biosynthesis protein G [Litoreibacter sp.]
MLFAPKMGYLLSHDNGEGSELFVSKLILGGQRFVVFAISSEGTGYLMLSQERMTRRRVLACLLASTIVTRPSKAQTTKTVEPFTFDWLKSRMQERAKLPDAPTAPLDNFLEDLNYDDYRNIYFRPPQSRWADGVSPFQLQAFHPGWLFRDPVEVYEVVDGQALPLVFDTDDFEYRNDLAERVPKHAELPGVAGLKVNARLNTPTKFDELVTFLGASYFRALGAGNSYGLSARGLSVDTWLNGPEEFPRFTSFWIVRPTAEDAALEVYAAMDSASVTGAYRFTISPGADTVIEVDAELNFRRSVRQLGLAPLTSMFYFAEHSERGFDDFRPQVHDSDALQIIRGSGDVLLRPLNNPHSVSNSYFSGEDVVQFGLLQRDRDYDAYQDAGAQYHNRPSVMIEPIGNWGAGSIRLVEIPAELEIEDNIVLFWIPDDAPQAGETRAYSYKMHWGALPADATGELAYIHGTRTGVGGPSGVPLENPNLRKFVIDFEGGALGDMAPETVVTPVVTTSTGKISGLGLHKIDHTARRWRLFFDVDGYDERLIEITAHVAGEDAKLTEVWLYQWERDPADLRSAEALGPVSPTDLGE